jgi:hypothetical protein
MEIREKGFSNTAMLKSIYRILKQSTHRYRDRKVRDNTCQRQMERERYRADPLSHPALQSMDQRQLGDLPFDPGCFDGDHRA